MLVVTVTDKDSLASLAHRFNVPPDAITAANGVPGRAPTCEWGRAVARWVLSLGGTRAPVSSAQPNKCEPGLGHVRFPASGVRIKVPAPSPSPSPSAPVVAAGVGGLGVLAVLAYLVSSES